MKTPIVVVEIRQSAVPAASLLSHLLASLLTSHRRCFSDRLTLVANMSRSHGWHTRVLATHWRPLILIRPICSAILTCISITTSVTGYVNAIRYLISSRCVLLKGSGVVRTNVDLSRNRPSISLTCGDMIDVSYVSIRHLTHSSIRPDTATKAELKSVKASTERGVTWKASLRKLGFVFNFLNRRWCFKSLL